MDALTLYAMTVCAGFSPDGPPCSAALYNQYSPSSSYTMKREDCLSGAAKIEKSPKYKAYCVGNDGVSLDASGKAVDQDAFYKALAAYYERQRSALSSK